MKLKDRTNYSSDVCFFSPSFPPFPSFIYLCYPFFSVEAEEKPHYSAGGVRGVSSVEQWQALRLSVPPIYIQTHTHTHCIRTHACTCMNNPTHSRASSYSVFCQLEYTPVHFMSVCHSISLFLPLPLFLVIRPHPTLYADDHKAKSFSFERERDS